MSIRVKPVSPQGSARLPHAGMRDADRAEGTNAGAAEAEPGWGTSYGWDQVPSFDSDVTAEGQGAAARADGDSAEPEWGATRGASAPVDLIGPFWDDLAVAREAIRAMLATVTGGTVPVSELAEATVALHELDSQLRATHAAALQQTVTANAIPDWSASPTAWVRHSHRLDADRAASAVRNSAWLAKHDATRAAFEAGDVGFDHITAIRCVADASARRRAAFAKSEHLLLNAARNADPARTARFLKWWSDAVDATDGDNDAAEAYAKRKLFLSPVGDGWDIRGYLPAVEGAELAGILNAFMEKCYRAERSGSGGGTPDGAPAPDDSVDDDEADKPTTSQRRADAQIEMARAAAAAGLTGGARDGAKVTVIVPVDRLTDNDHPTSPTSDVGLPAPWFDRPEAHACSWSVGNGPGQGFLAMAEALRLTCDGEITRLVLDADSRPLDIGRSTRIIPPQIRTALDVRDGGCIICPPGERPPGWCEAHHVQHWAADGRTAVENLALLCSKHHHDLHKGRWTITMRDGLPVVRAGPGQGRAGPSNRAAATGWRRE